MPTLILLLLMLLLPAASASAAGGGFGDATVIGVDTPVSTAVADFNEDGRADAATVSGTTGRVYMHFGKADGGFTDSPSLQVGSYLSQAVAGDFTGDGHEDLAVTSNANQKVHILTGIGDGRLILGIPITLDRHPSAIVVGDFNADGKEDLAIQNEKSALGSQVSVRLGTGTGTFTSLPDKATKAVALAISDFNSDQKEDLVFGTGGTPSGGILLGTGTGAFNVGPDIALPGFAGISRGWAAGDFNGDGNQDIAASLYVNGQVSVRLGKGDGTFGGGPDLPVGAKPGALAIGDVDADGDQDLAVANEGSGTVTVWRGGGAGEFVSVGELPVGKEPVDLALADFDGDGVDDLAVSNAGGGGVTVHRGLATPALAGNLLVNGGFEGARASGAPDDAPDIPGWQATGAITFTRYGAASHLYMPSLADSPRYGTGGSSFLWGGASAATGGVTAAAQTVDVSAAGASIDAGKATAGLSAYLGGALAYNDRMAARADFLGADGAVLGSLEIGPVTADDRRSLTTMLRRAGAAPVPSGTRRIRVTLTSTDEDKTSSSATADNVKLTLDAPEPPAPPAAFGADTRVTLSLAARRIKPKAPVRVRVANSNPFDVTGSVKLGRRAARVRLAPNGRAVVKLRLTPKLRRQLVRRHRLRLRLSALVRDPAGHQRTVRKRSLVRTATPR